MSLHDQPSRTTEGVPSDVVPTDFVEEPAATEISAGRVYRFLTVALLTAAVLVIASGLGWGWAWTGFPENGTFWAWFSLLALPIALAVLPLWLKTRRGHSVRWRIAMSVAALGFLVVVVGGYVFRWSWVGFYRPQGTVALWDWLTTLVQPAVIVLIPFWLKLRNVRARDGAVLAGSAFALFLVVVICGYVVPWEWTGFGDQKLWDWIQNFLVPFALPVALVFLDVEVAQPSGGDGGSGLLLRRRDGGRGPIEKEDVPLR